MQKVEDTLTRLVRQQKEQERAVGATVKAPYAKQRDSGDPDFHHQGPQTYRGGDFGRGTKDRMPGTTPYEMPSPSVVDKILDKLRIRKLPKPKRNQLKIKSKGTGNLI
jgi:hypothetical protein